MGNVDDSKKKKLDPNIIGLEELSSEELSESDDEPEVIENMQNETNDNQCVLNEKVIENIEENEEKTIVVESNTDSEVNKNNNIINKSNSQKKEEKKPLLEHPTFHVDVNRDPKIQVARLKLPILGEEQRIMELVNENEFLIVAGETGMFVFFSNLALI